MTPTSAAKPEHGDRYVTNRELSNEMKAFRWEVRFLVLAAGLANLGLVMGLKPSLVVSAAGYLGHLVT